MSVLSLMCIAVASACFASFSWGVFRLFAVRNHKMPKRMSALGLLSAAMYVAQVPAIAFPADEPRTISRIAGLLVCCGAFALFWWSVPYARRGGLQVAFSEGTSERLLLDGPYALVRHPFYAAYVSYWMAGALMSNSWILLAGSLLMLVVYLAAIRCEERHLLVKFEGYQAYRKFTFALLPSSTALKALWARKGKPPASLSR